MKNKTGKAEKKKTRKKWDEIFMNVFVIVLFGGILIWIVGSIYNEATIDKRMKDKYLASLPHLQDTIMHSKVCMVDDFFQGDSPSFPVFIDNKTYYGCSREVTTDLTTIDSFRFAIDPVSKQKVNKATAIITIHPDKDGKVIYFGSKETYDKYLSQLKTYKKE